MRILSVSTNFSQNRNVNFGRFADSNAKRVVREALTAEPDQDYMQPVYDSYFKRIEEDKNFEAYTSKNGTVKGRFDDEFVKNANVKITRSIEFLTRHKILDDLSVMKNLKTIADNLSDIKKILAGVNLADEVRSKNPHGDAREEEAERQARIDNLAD